MYLFKCMNDLFGVFMLNKTSKKMVVFANRQLGSGLCCVSLLPWTAKRAPLSGRPCLLLAEKGESRKSERPLTNSRLAEEGESRKSDRPLTNSRLTVSIWPLGRHNVLIGITTSPFTNQRNSEKIPLIKNVKHQTKCASSCVYQH